MSRRDKQYNPPDKEKHTSAYKAEPTVELNKNDLQEVISKYQKNPELLKLILASKVEEDRRKTEEAKLRSKELDLYINRQKGGCRRVSCTSGSGSFRRIVPYEMIDTVVPSLSTNTPFPKRRRSIQAISKIVETNEFPLNDGFFWKNNGNTLQKKTGCKSTYYKCANKGCTVNKTIIEQSCGRFTIKYRGEHVLDCIKVERVNDL
ncbi:unnamed protein product [Rhizopus stolonifer]